jgi:hypothetical protein
MCPPQERRFSACIVNVAFFDGVNDVTPGAIAAVVMSAVFLRRAPTSGWATLFNMSRNIGGAIGIARLQTFLTHRQHDHSEVLTAQISLLSEATRERIATTTSYIMANSGADALIALAFGDLILLQGICMATALLLMFLLKRPD